MLTGNFRTKFIHLLQTSLTAFEFDFGDSQSSCMSVKIVEVKRLLLKNYECECLHIWCRCAHFKLFFKIAQCKIKFEYFVGIL